MLNVTHTLVSAAYDFLRVAAFYDIPVPLRMQFRVKPLKDAWGYYYNSPHVIEIDAGIRSTVRLLKVVAHEMIHASLEQAAACDHEEHDENFRQVAKIVCERMGWSERGF
jgi:hypothetical protein